MGKPKERVVTGKKRRKLESKVRRRWPEDCATRGDGWVERVVTEAARCERDSRMLFATGAIAKGGPIE